MPTYLKLGQNEVAPTDINCFTDGGVSHPTVSWACLAGIGVWWPKPLEGLGRQAQAPQDGGRLRSSILHTKATDTGIQQWNMFPGQMCSSTRAEIAAVAAALTYEDAIHIGIDNQGALGNARRFISIATAWGKAWEENPSWTPPKYPLGKAWGLLPDGDMLKTVWQGINTRGSATRKLSKVKGHATAEDIAAGTSTILQRAGNNEADTCANLGVQEAAKDSKGRIVAWLVRRQALYGLWLKDINKLIVQILKAEKEQREEKQRAETFTRGYDVTKLQHLSCNINTDLEGSVEADAMVLLPYQRSQYLDEFTNNLTADVHKYLQEATWRRWVPGIKKSGTTWIELLARFDLLGYRSLEAIQKENKQAHKIYVERCKQEGEGLGDLAHANPLHEASTKPSLALELDTLKQRYEG